jgi:ParB/RepB/Spo0J family partition protein
VAHSFIAKTVHYRASPEMTSGEFHSIEINSIIVNRGERQRQQLKEEQLEELADSIEALGLIHPIVVTRELVLVSGERRLEACRRLGWTHISAQYTDELDLKRLQLLEYEENIKRVDLTADEQCHALVGFHELNVHLDPTWNQNKTADALHKSKSALSNDLRVAYAHVGGDKQICAAATMSAKRNILARRDERNTRLALAELDPTRHETILNFDFNEWAKTYSGPRFNFLHCDFPYGIGADKFNQSSAPVHGDYDDRPEVFDRLCQTLRDNIDRLCEPSAHMIFWFSIKHYPKVYGFLQSLGADWAVNPVPLIWAKPGEGIIPRPEHDPRQCYEAAFFCTRGGLPIVQSVDNVRSAPTVKGRHMSEKPAKMLRHFFRMIVSEHTMMLDPTCGSGSALRAAQSLMARRVLGLEVNPEFAALARLALEGAEDLGEAGDEVEQGKQERSSE